MDAYSQLTSTFKKRRIQKATNLKVVYHSDEEGDFILYGEYDNGVDECGKDVFDVHFDASTTPAAATTKIAHGYKKTQTINAKGDIIIKQKYKDAWTSEGSIPYMGLNMTELQRMLFKPVFKYSDVFFMDRSWESHVDLLQLLCLHTVNHISKTRELIMKNNVQLAKDATLECRDQGFTRPRVLILLPFKNIAYTYIHTLYALSGSTAFENHARFESEFAPDDDIEQEKAKMPRPQDWVERFGGNTDDHFRIGIKFTGGKGMKVYGDFYGSDVIVASPLGLRTLIGVKGDKKRDYDYLSSIDVVIMDQCESFLMQNWEHLEHVLAHTNLMPTESRDTDFSRVKHYFLDGVAREKRQTIVVSQCLTPEINSLSRFAANTSGRVTIVPETYPGVLTTVTVPAQHVFLKVEAASPVEDIDARFAFFKQHVLQPLLSDTTATSREGTLLFVPDYFAFTRIRNHLNAIDASVAYISEYTSDADISRARSDFFHRKVDFLVITERWYFFRRYKLRGVRNVVCYGVPEFAEYYKELVEFMGGGMDGLDGDMTSTVVYSVWDKLKLERVVGTKRCGRMLSKDGTGVFRFA